MSLACDDFNTCIEVCVISVCSYSEAKSDMELSLKTLRGNPLIDYKQLGLQYKLYSCEVREGGRGRGTEGMGC